MSFSAVVLAGGSGRRMGGDVKKQYMDICGRPVIYYPLRVFEKSDVDEIVLVVSPGDEDYVKREIVERYDIKKVSAIVRGGAERYDSVRCGIEAASGEFVLIHDGARAMVTSDIIGRTMEAVEEYGACVVGMPSKDTVKIADEDGCVADTPSRDRVWTIQTPQAFLRSELITAYERLDDMADGYDGITDDAMVMERAGMNRSIRLIRGSFDNIKLTTPEDVVIAEGILKKSGK